MRLGLLTVLAFALPPALAPLVRAGAPGPDAARPAAPAGEWRTTLETQNGNATMTVDLGRVGTRWVGTFDLEGFPIEDYPVEVRVAGDSVTLSFSAIRLDFRGAFTNDGRRMRGSFGDADTVVFERVGDARFADQFLEMEAAAEDSTAVLPLSSDAHELRAAFNRDTDRVRLLLLLSPT
jgi:hypothetical protein